MNVGACLWSLGYLAATLVTARFVYIDEVDHRVAAYDERRAANPGHWIAPMQQPDGGDVGTALFFGLFWPLLVVYFVAIRPVVRVLRWAVGRETPGLRRMREQREWEQTVKLAKEHGLDTPYDRRGITLDMSRPTIPAASPPTEPATAPPPHDPDIWVDTTNVNRPRLVARDPEEPPPYTIYER